MKPFLIAEAPDGGFGFKNDKRSRLCALFLGSPEDMIIAESTFDLCKSVTERPLYLGDIINRAWVTNKHKADGTIDHVFVQFRMNRDKLISLAKDAEDPEEAIMADISLIGRFSDFLYRNKGFLEEDPYGDERMAFLDAFSKMAYVIMENDLADCPLSVCDMECMQTEDGWEEVDENLKEIRRREVQEYGE